MRESSNALVQAITPEIEALAEKMREAQEAAVVDRLTDEHSVDQVQVVVAEAEIFAEALTQKHLAPNSPLVACKTGCSWCCYQLVRVSAPEIFRIARYLDSASMTDTRAEIVERLRTLNKATCGLNEKGRINVPKSCAFLKDGQCSIYAVRPLACAEFTSYDVIACKRGKRVGFKSDGVIHEMARMLAYNSVQQGLADGLRKALPRADTAWLELTAAVVQALDTPNAEEAWLSGEKIFSDAHLGSSHK